MVPLSGNSDDANISKQKVDDKNFNHDPVVRALRELLSSETDQSKKSDILRCINKRISEISPQQPASGESND